ncbi:hypothetical protein REPUB_Repub11eG0007300 [Reevesia pubescens]
MQIGKWELVNQMDSNPLLLFTLKKKLPTQMVSGLDRSWQRPPGVAAKLIDCKAANGLYYIEYTLQNPGESREHLFSAIGMASNGWYNRLYTVTGQFVEEETEKYGSRIEKVALEGYNFLHLQVFCQASLKGD